MPPVQQASPQAKTVMGYAAADLLKQAGITPGAQPGSFGQQPPQGFAPQGPPQGFPPPQQGFPPQGPPQGFAPPPQQPSFAPPPQAFPPPPQGGQFGGSASTAATMFMQNAPQIPVQPPQPMPSAPAPFAPPPQSSFPQMPQQPAAQPYPPAGNPYPPAGNPYPPAGGMPAGMPAPNPYSPMPVGQMPGQPPYLASQTAARANKPIEPYNDTTKLVLLAFGAALLGFFLIPLSLSPFAVMPQAIGDLPGAMKLLPILIALGGVGGVLLAVMPMAPLARGGLAALLGAVPILLFSTVVIGFDWHTLVYPVGGILVPAGLLLRDKYPTDSLPRLFIFIGAGCIALPFFLPFHIVDLVLDILKSIIHPSVLIAMLGGFIPLLLATLAVLLAVIPGQFKFGAKQLAWAWFTFPIAIMIAQLTVNGSILDVITHSPGLLFSWSAIAMPSADPTANASFALPLYTSFAAFATFGVCTLFGKQLEMAK